jgi:hypothetical protein
VGRDPSLIILGKYPHSKNLCVDPTRSTVGIVCLVRVDLTRMRVIKNKNMRVESTRRRMVREKQQQKQKKKLSTWVVPVDLRFMYPPSYAL